MGHQQRREFRRESFKSSRDWVHFCAEFDLRICQSCRRRSRIAIGITGRWECRSCVEHGCRDPLPLHPDLWKALREGEESTYHCPICREATPLSRAWISEDARRLYCRHHLKPISTADRIEKVSQHLKVVSIQDPRQLTKCPERIEKLQEHLSRDRCQRCRFNGSAIYRGRKLVEIDADRRRCISSPDALNCAGIDH